MNNGYVRSFSGFSKKAIIVIIIITFIVIFAAKSVFSHHQKQVLGDVAIASELVLPPVTSGAGFILPDSPLFFLDKMFQQIRLVLAFTPERRAKTHSQIAGERLAELRIMLARNDSDGISTALSDLSQEVSQMSTALSDAAADGRDVSLLAREFNETIKTQRKILGILKDQTEGVLKLQLKTARETLKTAKIEIEDELEEDELENEIEEDLNDEIEEELEEASGSAKRLEHAIDVLSKLASRAAEKQQIRREEALRHAIEVKDEALRKQEEKLQENEEKKHKKLLEAQAKVHEKAREAIKKAQEATEELKDAQRAVREAKREAHENSSSGSSNSGSFKSSDNSGSGSSNSGSGSSGSESSGSGSGSSGSGKSGSDDDDD